MQRLCPVFAIVLTAFASLPATADECHWQLKEITAPRGGGIVCAPVQMHYQMATLACDVAPLYLDLQSDCDADDGMCSVHFDLDSDEFTLRGAYVPAGQIWASFIRIPMSAHDDFLAALRHAQHVTVRVDGRDAWAMPTQGLSATMESLASQCEAKTS
jgi:hypothetical protein